MNDNDLRVQKTHTLLRKALLDLLETKSFEALTISELCDQAMIRRSTFYRHYCDKYDFLNAILEDFIESARHMHIDQFNLSHPKAYFYQYLAEILSFMDEHRKLVRALGGIYFNNEVAGIYYERIQKVISLQVEEDEKAGILFKVDKKTYIEFLSGGVYRVIHQWIVERQQTPVEKIATELANLLTVLRQQMTQ